MIDAIQFHKSVQEIQSGRIIFFFDAFGRFSVEADSEDKGSTPVVAVAGEAGALSLAFLSSSVVAVAPFLAAEPAFLISLTFFPSSGLP